jgi:hypothetical protein
MRTTPLRRAAMLVLLLAVMIGWSAQAFSLAMTGSCAMGDMDMSTTAPENSSSDNEDDSGSMPCKGITVRCMNNLGCIASVAVPQPLFVVEQPERFDDLNAVLVSGLIGLSLKPELSPPIQMA